ncbi:MAG TPA: PadR family transcriptional regulator [Streptosporangiaceae bacterium]|nr:PadR family transcriptional regulator [Streptosporangiaceae bacterium]
MNDHINEEWEHPLHHAPGAKRYRARQRLAARAGLAGRPGFDAGDERARFARDPGFRGQHDEFGEPDFAFGPGFHGRPGFRMGPPGFGPRGYGYGRRGGRARRGDVRAAALALLSEEPMNGYQIIQQIGERSGGLWRPSPGSVYPALAQLEDEGLIESQGSESGRRAFALTEAGRAYATEHADELRAPWSALAGDGASAAADIHQLVRQVHLAALGVLSAGSDSQLSQARKVLAQTRRALYRILAEDDEAEREAPDADNTATGQEAS